MYDKKSDPFDDPDAMSFKDIKATKLDMEKLLGRPPKKKRRGVFLPQNWIEKLQGAKHVAVWPLACFLQHKNWMRPGEAITVSNVTLDSLGVSRGQKCRALQELETLGLIEIKRCGKHSPTVKLLV
jgi:hypothetical protein